MVMRIKQARVLLRATIVILILGLIASLGINQLYSNDTYLYNCLVGSSCLENIIYLKPELSKRIYQPAVLRGIEFSLQTPNQFIFSFDTMQSSKMPAQDIERLIKYFFEFLTIPEDKLWVNLSPYESNRIIPDGLEKLNIGKDMLLEDYLLKKTTSHLISSNLKEVKKFWQEIEKNAYSILGTDKLLIDSLSKIWIVPDTADICEYKSKDKVVAFVKDAKLKVMIEQDYLASRGQRIAYRKEEQKPPLSAKRYTLNAKIKEIFKRELLPIIEREINFGVRFAPLRQLYYSLILATYCKEKLALEPSYRQYIDKELIANLALPLDNKIKTKVYKAYLNDFYSSNNKVYLSQYDYQNKKAKIRKISSGGLIPTPKVRIVSLPQSLVIDSKDKAWQGREVIANNQVEFIKEKNIPNNVTPKKDNNLAKSMGHWQVEILEPLPVIKDKVLIELQGSGKNSGKTIRRKVDIEVVNGTEANLYSFILNSLVASMLKRSVLNGTDLTAFFPQIENLKKFNKKVFYHFMRCLKDNKVYLVDLPLSVDKLAGFANNEGIFFHREVLERVKRDFQRFEKIANSMLDININDNALCAGIILYHEAAESFASSTEGKIFLPENFQDNPHQFFRGPGKKFRLKQRPANEWESKLPKIGQDYIGTKDLIFYPQEDQIIWDNSRIDQIKDLVNKLCQSPDFDRKEEIVDYIKQLAQSGQTDDRDWGIIGKWLSLAAGNSKETREIITLNIIPEILLERDMPAAVYQMGLGITAKIAKVFFESSPEEVKEVWKNIIVNNLYFSSQNNEYVEFYLMHYLGEFSSRFKDFLTDDLLDLIGSFLVDKAKYKTKPLREEASVCSKTVCSYLSLLNAHPNYIEKKFRENNIKATLVAFSLNELPAVCYQLGYLVCGNIMHLRPDLEKSFARELENILLNEKLDPAHKAVTGLFWSTVMAVTKYKYFNQDSIKIIINILKTEGLAKENLSSYPLLKKLGLIEVSPYNAMMSVIITIEKNSAMKAFLEEIISQLENIGDIDSQTKESIDKWLIPYKFNIPAIEEGIRIQIRQGILTLLGKYGPANNLAIKLDDFILTVQSQSEGRNINVDLPSKLIQFIEEAVNFISTNEPDKDLSKIIIDNFLFQLELLCAYCNLSYKMELTKEEAIGPWNILYTLRKFDIKGKIKKVYIRMQNIDKKSKSDNQAITRTFNCEVQNLVDNDSSRKAIEIVIKQLETRISKIILPDPKDSISYKELKYFRAASFFILKHLKKLLEQKKIYITKQPYIYQEKIGDKVRYLRALGGKYLILSRNDLDDLNKIGLENIDIFNNPEARSLAIILFHEAGHSLAFSHTDLRGLGKDVRANNSEDRLLTKAEETLPKDKLGHSYGIQDLIFGPEDNKITPGGINFGLLKASAPKVDILTLTSESSPKILGISFKTTKIEYKASLEKLRLAKYLPFREN